jgi:hypothetical protein
MTKENKTLTCTLVQREHNNLSENKAATFLWLNGCLLNNGNNGNVNGIQSSYQVASLYQTVRG